MTQINPSCKTWLCLPGYWHKSTGLQADPHTPADLLDPKVAATIEWEAAHADFLDYVWEIAVGGYKALNAAILATRYDVLFQVNTEVFSESKGTFLTTWLAAHPEYTFEDIFSHYSEATTIEDITDESDPDSINRDAYSAEAEESSRVVDHSWNVPAGLFRYRLNFTNAGCQAFLADWFTEIVTKDLGSGVTYDGAEFDVLNWCEGWDSPTNRISYTTGGTILEQGALTDADYYAAAQTILGAMLATTAAGQANEGKLIGGNLAGYYAYWPLEQVCNIVRREGITNVASYVASSLKIPLALCGRLSARGGSNLISHYCSLAGALGRDSELALWNRDKLFGLAMFYLIANPDKDYFLNWHTYSYGSEDVIGNDSHWGPYGGLARTQAMYCPACEVDIGAPLGAMLAGKSHVQLLDETGYCGYSDDTIFPSGVAEGEPVYATYTFIMDSGTDAALEALYGAGTGAWAVYGRLYTDPEGAPGNTKALVLAFPLGSYYWANHIGIYEDAGHAHTVALGGTYYPVAADGSVGEGITEITLSPGEGAILLASQEAAIDPPGSTETGNATPGSGKITLTWGGATEGTYSILGYAIYRSTTAGGQSDVPLATTDANTFFFEDTQVLAGVTYYYKVRAFDISEPPLWGDYSLEKHAAPFPLAPTGVEADVANGIVTLSWLAATGAATYAIYRANTSGGYSPVPLAVVPSTELSYEDAQVVPGRSYYYVVNAADAQAPPNDSGHSSQVMVTVPSVTEGGVPVGVALDFTLSVIGTLTKADGTFGTGSHKAKINYSKSLTDGTAANQADRIYEVEGNVTAAGPVSIDVAGALVNLFGGAAVFAKIKQIVIVNTTTTSGKTIEVGGDANGLIGMLVDKTDKISVGPDGCIAWMSPVDGYTVTGGTGDILAITTGSATAVGYKVMIVGTSA